MPKQHFSSEYPYLQTPRDKTCDRCGLAKKLHKFLVRGREGSTCAECMIDAEAVPTIKEERRRNGDRWGW